MTTSSMMIPVAIHGASGKVGRRLCALAADEGFRVAAAFVSAGSSAIGIDAGTLAGIAPVGVAATADLAALAHCKAAIDFSTREAALPFAAACARAGVPLLVATTGFSSAERAEIDAFAQSIPLLVSANTSLGVALLARIVADAARLLGDAYDVEIVEVHHRMKKDAPSGTALLLAESIAEATGRDLAKERRDGRSGNTGARSATEIGIHAVRLGDVVGEHTVSFAAPGERLEFVHRASSRDLFARGALRAARFLMAQPPGRYCMADALGLR